jgi:hypothetical protein
LASALLASLCGLNGCASPDAADTPPLDGDDVTRIVHSSVKNQTIGNCWVYAHLGWIESMNKQATNAELNLSESYATYIDEFVKITSNPDGVIDSKGEFTSGGTWDLFKWEAARYGAMLEQDFIADEAASTSSFRQSAAQRAITESLKNGPLKTREARLDRELVRAELDRAWQLTPDVTSHLDQAFGRGLSKTISETPRETRVALKIMAPEDVPTTTPDPRTHAAVKVTMRDVLRSTTYGWQQVKYPSVPEERRAFQVRVQRAMHDGAPVLIWWNVGFGAARGNTFSATQLAERGPGRTGGHMTLMYDYQVKLGDGAVLKAGETISDRALLDKALAPSSQVEFWRSKNSWGGGGTNENPEVPPGGYYDLEQAYLDATIGELGTGWVAAVLPAGY